MAAGRVDPELVARYELTLRMMDWQFEYSDSSAVRAKAKDRLDWLRATQPEVDPDFSIWNRYAPKGMR